MWHSCRPKDEDPAEFEQFQSVTDWSVPGVGEIGFNGPLELLSVRGTSLGFRFARTTEEREGYTPVDLPHARFVVTDSAIELTLPTRPSRRFLQPPLNEGYGLPSIEWRAASDELRIIASGVRFLCAGGLWHWKLDWDE